MHQLLFRFGMKAFWSLLVLGLFQMPVQAGDNVDEDLEIVGVNPFGEYLVLEKWLVQGEMTEQFPMLFAIYRSNGHLVNFAEIPLLAGLTRKDMDEKYPAAATKKWAEVLGALRKAGYSAEGIETLKVETDSKLFSTVTLPDGRTITERGKSLRRKPNNLQEESISLWIAPKAGAPATLLKDKAIQTVVRSFSQHQIQKAYWLKPMKTVVALYNNPGQEATGREGEIWSYQFE
jgi:hypothetical protein